MPENRKLKVFLAHSKDDKLIVRKYYHRLIANGFDVWLDEEKIIPGQDWDLEIRKAIRSTDVFIVFLSKNSITKEGYIQKEIRIALDIADEKPEGTNFFIPARIEECLVPVRIDRFHWVNLFEQEGYKKLKDALEFRMNDLNIRFTLDEIRGETNNTIRVPILGPIAAGPLMLVPESGINYMNEKEYKAVDIARSFLPSREKGNELYALEVKGDSMLAAMINDGDIVVMKKAVEARNGEMVAVRVDDEYMLTYLFREKNGYRLQPANPEMEPIYVPLNKTIEVNGKVVMVIRKMTSL
jgi:SOS-response transcriptional repressor LexA